MSFQKISKATHDVLSERKRQIDGEGYTHEHDDEHDNGELPAAAAWYALPDQIKAVLDVNDLSFWPWDLVSCDSKDRRRELVCAAALIIAEIDRIDRKENIPDGVNFDLTDDTQRIEKLAKLFDEKGASDPFPEDWECLGVRVSADDLREFIDNL